MKDHQKAAGMVILLAMLVAAADQGCKWLLVRHLMVGESSVLVPRVLELTYRQNRYAAFSALPSLSPTMLLAISLLVLVIFTVLIWPYLCRRTIFAAAVLVYGGAFGNLIDRVRLHYVVDYLDFRVWPVFNFADICVVVGVGLLMLGILRADRALTASSVADSETGRLSI